MLTVTVVIPVGPGHERLVKRAIASVDNQTYVANVVTVYDKHGKGPGWARNEGLRQVNTDYVVFLDADDWLEPHALESMIALAAEHPDRYVYSDWWRDGEIVETPPTGYAWCGGTWHPITALIPANWVREVDGFDETLPGGEDTDFYLRLITSMRCGIRLAAPLVHYSPDGQRAISFHNRQDFRAIMERIGKKYSNDSGGLIMACCGQRDTVPVQPNGERQPGDVLAMALWGGNRREHGRATGRAYPRTGNGKRVWVDPRDVEASPNLWQRVPELERVSDDGVEPIPDAVEGMQAIANQAMDAYNNTPRVTRYQPPRGKREQTAPDVAAIIRMAGESV